MNTAADGLSVDGVHVWRGDRHVLQGCELASGAARAAAHQRPERHGQDHVAAGGVRPAAAGAGAGLLAREVDFEHSARISGGARLCLARARAQGRSDCPGESAFCGGTEAAGRDRTNCAPGWNKPGSQPVPICPPACCRPGSAAGLPWRGCWPWARPLWLLDEPFTNLDAAGADLMSGLLRCPCRRRRLRRWWSRTIACKSACERTAWSLRS